MVRARVGQAPQQAQSYKSHSLVELAAMRYTATIAARE
jgi:hypothetical protein